jgi:hypothetical protein
MAMNTTVEVNLKLAKSKECKVLVVGEDRANLQSVFDSITHVELSNSGVGNVKMNVTMVPLTIMQLRQPKELDKVMPKLSIFHAIIVVVDARPVYLSLVGNGGKLHFLLEKIILFGIPEEGVYLIATGDKAMSEHDSQPKEYRTVRAVKAQPVVRGGSLGGVLTHHEATSNDIVSRKLLEKLGPLQLGHLHDFIGGVPSGGYVLLLPSHVSPLSLSSS